MEIVAFALRTYVILENFLTNVYTQTKRTFHAILDSFDEKDLYFYSDSISILPYESKHSWAEPYWIFFQKERLFSKMDATGNLKHLPYLGMEILIEMKDQSQIQLEISDWIETVHVVETDRNVPPRILVQTYFWDTQTFIDFERVSTISLKVITEDGEDASFSIPFGVRA